MIGSETTDVGAGGIGNINAGDLTVNAVRVSDGALVSRLEAKIEPELLVKAELYPLTR